VHPRFTGFLIDLLKEVSRRANLSYEVSLAPDGKYGSLDEESGAWSGVVGEVAPGPS
jgi:ionotropic kainate glutamate receptor 2